MPPYHFSANLKFLREKKGLKQAQIPDVLGFTQTAWNNYEKGKSTPKFEDLIKISKYFEVDEASLIHNDLSDVHLTEEGESGKKVHPIVHPTVHPKGKKGGEAEEFSHIEEYELPVKKVPRGSMPKVITINSQGEENAVYVPVKARAGYLVGYGDPQFIEKLPAYNLPGLRNGTYRIFEVDGLSMFNTLQDKDKVIARWVQPSEIRDDRIHVLITKHDGLLIKRVLNRLSEGKLICKSDNNHRGEYPNMVLDADEVLEAWYVVERWTRMLPNPGEIYKRIVDLEADMAIIKQNLLKS